VSRMNAGFCELERKNPGIGNRYELTHRQELIACTLFINTVSTEDTLDTKYIFKGLRVVHAHMRREY
jgi:hypothetical protein